MGMPSSIPMTDMGMRAPRSATKSRRSDPTSGSSTSAQSARIRGSSAFIFFGVNTRESRLRWAVWSGGSSKMNTPDGSSIFALISSRMLLSAELKVMGSLRAASQSSKRVTAKKSCGSL